MQTFTLNKKKNCFIEFGYTFYPVPPAPNFKNVLRRMPGWTETDKLQGYENNKRTSQVRFGNISSSS